MSAREEDTSFSFRLEPLEITLILVFISVPAGITVITSLLLRSFTFLSLGRLVVARAPQIAHELNFSKSCALTHFWDDYLGGLRGGLED
jgi:hypothetical protein